MRNQNYKADLLADLRSDPEFASQYLDAAMTDSPEAFLIALRDVAESQDGIAKLAADAHVNRENLYRILSKEGNPRWSTLTSVLDGMGIELKPQLKRIVMSESVPEVAPSIPVMIIGVGTGMGSVLFSQIFRSKNRPTYVSVNGTEIENQNVVGSGTAPGPSIQLVRPAA
jgi:probable addiction module antidote protein